MKCPKVWGTHNQPSVFFQTRPWFLTDLQCFHFSGSHKCFHFSVKSDSFPPQTPTRDNNSLLLPVPDGLSTGFSLCNLVSFISPSASPCAESLEASSSINKYFEINKPADSNVDPVVCPWHFFLPFKCLIRLLIAWRLPLCSWASLDLWLIRHSSELELQNSGPEVPRKVCEQQGFGDRSLKSRKFLRVPFIRAVLLVLFFSLQTWVE